jgi:rhamnosyl/mannosyltransferase
VKLVSEFDFVIFHAPWPFINILALFTPKKVKKVLFYHSDLIGKGILGYIYNKLLLRPVLSQFELIIFTSEKYRAGSVVAKVMDTKIRIIPLGIPKVKIFDLPLASILNSAEEFVLFLGSLREYKGLKYLLDSASCDGSILYVIAGSGVCKNDLLRIKEEKNLNNLLFLEDVGEELKASLLMNCSLLVLPSISRAEAFGLVILEAMAYGKPVITTEIGTATSEINIHGITGLVVPPMNSIALYHAIRCLMNKPRLRTRLGRAGKKRVECYYSEQLMFESFHGALLQLSNYEKC